MRIDHVIYATADLGAAAAHVERVLGVAASPGGRHDGMGTHNLIVPLDGGYLELLAVCDPTEAAGSALGAAVQARIERDGDGLLGWAVAVDAIEPVAARLRSPVTRIGRRGLTAQLTGLSEALNEPLLPFFVARDPGVADPGAVGGDVGGIEWIEVAGDRTRLASWVGSADLPVRVCEGAPAVRGVCVDGRELR